MTDEQTLAYVQAAATALELPLPPDRAQRVATHLARTAALARLLEDCPLGPEDEPAEIYKPKVPSSLVP